MRNLRSVNLNLFPVLRELLRKQNVTHAAQALNMSQSAASDALARLRHLLQDEILVPDGRRMRLTSYAQRIEKVVEDCLTQMEELVCELPLDISSEEATLKIATVDYVVDVFGRKLLRRVAADAPKLTIHFVNISHNSVQDLSAGVVDFILTAAPKLTGTFERAPLFMDQTVCVVPASSPYGAQLTDEEFWSARHAAYTPGESVLESLHSTILRQFKEREFNAVITQNLSILPFVAAAADAIALVPKMAIERMKDKSEFRVVELPFTFPPFCVSAYWNPSNSHNRVHRWLQEILVDLSDVIV